MHPRKGKVGVVGCGVVAAAYYLPNLMDMETVDLVAVRDRFETRTRPRHPRTLQPESPAGG